MVREKYSVINNSDVSLNYKVSEVKDRFCEISVRNVSRSRIHTT